MRDEGNLARAVGPMTALSAEDRMLAATLQHAVHELQATTGTAMVPLEDGRTLANVIVVGDPMSVFTVADRHPVDDDRYTGAVAYRTGRQCVRVRSETPSGVRPVMPFPYAIVATPLTDDEGRAFGVIVLVWADPVGWAAKSARVRHRCRSLTAELSRALLRRGGLPPGRHFPEVPRFILAPPSGEDAVLESVSLSLVHQIGRLAAELSQAPGLRDVVETAIARIMEPFGARCLAISVVDAGRPRLLGYAGSGPALAARLVRASTGTLEEEASTGAGPPPERPLFFEAVDTDEPIAAYCLLPLATDDHGAGTLALGFDHRRTFRAEERAALATVAQLLAQSIGRARQFETERRLAQELQQGLLPAALPQHGEVDIAARYVTPTTGTVGGDWYDVVNLPDGGIGLVVGDVEGHTPRAAALMGQIRSAVRAYATEGHRPADVLTRTNRLLVGLGTDLLATCCCVWLDPEAESVEVSSAGHPAPLLGHPGRRFTTPELPVGTPLGVRPDTCYGSGRAPLHEGTVLVLYTDGLVRSRSVPLDHGVEALHAHLAAPGDLRLEVLADRVLDITGAGDLRDDDAVLLIAQFLGLGADRRQRVARTSVERHDLRAVADVRGFLRTQARAWNWEAVSSDLELAVTELVTNGLVHADSEVEIRLREYADRLRVDVRDSDPRPPLPAPVLASGEPDSESEHGRGLLIVDALASSWGNSPSGRGKSVWFELTRP
ncbi:ATP-binding SpoIIE family protein phosphatase [Streptomyces sp. bgisy027]|uniref:ATP-binding SpoIIE family protein phosphatase n=1 Tax=Streptomyces sp. bgisy027 TaxID=3413770 RepID=UPI003D745E67